jgi:SAM-dependent methyltransferase
MSRQFLPAILAFADHERDRWVASEASKIRSGAVVLDVGAGPCRYRHLFSHCDYRTQDFMQHEGTELGALADAGLWQYGQIDYVCDAASMPLPDAMFDAVLCTEVLEHVHNPSRVVQEIGRILKPGGQLILSAPLGSGLHQDPDHYYGGFTPYWYQRVLPSAGFEAISIIPNGGFFKNYGQESQRFSAWLDPRRLKGWPRVVLALPWLVTLPWFRLVLPVACHFLDRLDHFKGFTVGYHVTASRSARVTEVAPD